MTSHRARAVAAKMRRGAAFALFLALSFYAYAHHLTKIVTPDFFAISQRIPQQAISWGILFIPPLLFCAVVAAGRVERNADRRAWYRAARYTRIAAWTLLVAIAFPIFSVLIVFQSLVQPIVPWLVAVAVAVSALLARRRNIPAIYPFIFFLAIATYAYRWVDFERPLDESAYEKTLDQRGVVPLATYAYGRPARAHGPDPAGSCPHFPVGEYPIENPPHFLYYLTADPEERYIYAADVMSAFPASRPHPYSSLFRYELTTGRFDALPLPTRTEAITYDTASETLWVGNVGFRTLLRIPAKAFEHPVEFACEVISQSRDRNCVCPDDAGQLYREYPAHRDVQKIVIEHERNRMIVFYETPSDELAWRPLPHELTIWQIQPRRILMGVPNPSADVVVKSPKTGHFYTQVDWIPPGVAELDNDTLEIRRTLMWPFGFGLETEPATGDLFLVNPLTGRLYGIDPATLTVTGSMKIGIGLHLVAADARRDLLYIGNYFNGEFHVVSWKDKRVLATVNVGPRNYAILVLPKSGRVFTTTTYGFFEIQVDELLEEARGTI
ncbi:hypothetical protein K8I61_20315 [bacterium]|nr:hypothetical protein [bacterium]